MAEFTPTDDWEEVPPGAAILPGLETRMDLASGKNYARKAPGTDRREAVLGMPVSKVLEVWEAVGKPEISIRDGNITDLALLLSHAEVNPEHLEAIKEWLKKRTNKLEGGNGQ
jgi:hypothetical protein